VLSGGGARGAYEAGVLAHVYEHVLPRLPRAFDVTSGTSVGAIHAAYTSASMGMEPNDRARRLVEIWCEMQIEDVIDVSATNLLRLPLRALGFSRSGRISGVGGIIDSDPLRELVSSRIPWDALRENLAQRPAALCVSCTEVRSGRVTIFMDGALSDAAPWDHDPNATAIRGPLGPSHVSASAAIPFLFPAVRIGERHYVDGGLRMNTPLSPALRLRAERVLVVALKHGTPANPDTPAYDEDVITQPAFLLGKVLDALTLDQLEYELQRIDVINALIERGQTEYGDDFLHRINETIREKRGVGFRPVRYEVVRPSQDIGRLAASCYARSGGTRALGLLPELVARLSTRGVPADEADLLSYIYYDRGFTRELVDLGREDARAREDSLFELLAS
jgi:NTE family protein